MISELRRSPGTWARLFTIFAVTACQAGGDVAQSNTNSSAATDSAAAIEIRQTITAYLDAVERGDAAAAADFWDPETRVLAPGMDAGRQAVVDFMRTTFEAGTRVDVLSRRTLELSVEGDAAYEIAQAEEVMALPGAARADTVRNNIFVRWKKGSDGKWRFHRALLGPQAAPPPSR
jgi:uncharacterized protein (TIGR02246 family)